MKTFIKCLLLCMFCMIIPLRLSSQKAIEKLDNQAIISYLCADYIFYSMHQPNDTEHILCLFMQFLQNNLSFPKEKYKTIKKELSDTLITKDNAHSLNMAEFVLSGIDVSPILKKHMSQKQYKKLKKKDNEREYRTRKYCFSASNNREIMENLELLSNSVFTKESWEKCGCGRVILDSYGIKKPSDNAILNLDK